jgi:hypothetical protein
MQLPQELVCEIINHLPLPECCPADIRTCSLVTKSWVHPSQRRLFEDVNIDDWSLQLWLKNISPTNSELLGHVRSLSYTADLTRLRVGRLDSVLRDYLPSFCQLRHLKLSTISLLPQQIEVFSAFRHTLEHISLSHGVVTIGGLITLINYIPNLTELELDTFGYHSGGFGPLPLLSRPLERLSVTGSTTYNLDLFDRLSGLGFSADEVEVSKAKSAKRVTDAFGVRAKRLRLLGSSNIGSIYPNPVVWNPT